MYTWLRFLVVATLAVSCLAPTTEALEKTAARFDEDRDDWGRGTSTCQVLYYNTCQGWVWIWGGWSPGERFGVTFQSCCGTGYGFQYLSAGWVYFWTGSPSGYGFTGSIDVWAADANGCPTGAPLHSQSWLPAGGWNGLDYSGDNLDVTGTDFVITYTTNPSAMVGDPMSITSDHPLAGPTGVPACGTCYPTTRTTHSFYFGTTTSPVCPGSPLNDGLCDVEFFMDIGMLCSTVSVEAQTWGGIKQLYR